MQSKTSFFNKALFKKNLSRTWIVGLLYFLTLSFSISIPLGIQLNNYQHSYYYESGFSKAMLMYEYISNVPVAPFAMFATITAATITFWYLFNKRDNYMMHGFPVSRKSLYFTGIATSAIVTIIPVLLNAVVMTIIAVAAHANVFDAIWYTALVSLVSVVLFLSLSMFSLMISGQSKTAVIFYVIFNFLYLLMEIAFRMTAEILMFGTSMAMSTIRYNMLTPSLFIDSNCHAVTSYRYNDNGMIENFLVSLVGQKELAIYLVAALVLFAIAYLLYKFKKLETVHDFIAVPFMKPVFSVGMSFFVSMTAGALVSSIVESFSPLSYSTKYAIGIVAAIIIGIIIFYATKMMIEKTIRVFSFKTFSHCFIYSVAALVMLVALRLDLFKVEDYVPNAEDIEWVGIDCDYIMVFTDEDEINTVRELHKNFLEDKKELRNLTYNYPDENMDYMVLKYKLKSGRVVYRAYNVMSVDSDMATGEYVAATEPILDFLNAPSRIKEHILGNIWDDCQVTEMSFTSYLYNDTTKELDSYYENLEYLPKPERMSVYQEVYQALLKDIDDGNVLRTCFGDNYQETNLYDDFSFTIANSKIPYFSDNEHYYAPEYGNKYQILDTFESSIYVCLNKDCTNTLEALKNAGFYMDDTYILTMQEANELMGYYDDYYY